MTDPTSPRPHVSVLGLGRMGTPIAEALLASGHRTTVWNRSPDKAAPLVDAGAHHADTVTAAVRDSPLIVLPLLDYAAVHAVLAPAAHELSGTTLVNLANGTPQEARSLGAWADRHGCLLLDGAMLALPATVGTPDAMFLYSGARKAHDTYLPTLETLSTVHYFGPDHGLAEVHDLALLGSGYAAVAGFLHAAALLDTVGTSPTRFAALATAWLHGIAAFLPELAREAETGHYDKGVSTVDLNRVAVTNLIHLSETQRVPTDLHTPLRDLLEHHTRNGDGAQSVAALYTSLRPAPAPHTHP